jgi:hypothetical protein
MFWMKKIPFIFLFFSSTLFAQELDTYKLGKAINFLTENKKILSEKWIELVKNKKVNYKKILGGEMIFKVWDTLAYRNLSFFSRDMNISRDSLLDCEGKTISVAEQKICDRVHEVLEEPITRAAVMASDTNNISITLARTMFLTLVSYLAIQGHIIIVKRDSNETIK